MIKFTCFDFTKKHNFELCFWDIYKAKKFLIKCKYSNKIKVVGYSYDEREEEEEIAYFFDQQL